MTRIGPAGWAYKDWRRIVYPAKKPRAFLELAFLTRYFDTLEINVSFYRPLTAKTAADWLEKVRENRNFRFTAKPWRASLTSAGPRPMTRRSSTASLCARFAEYPLVLEVRHASWAEPGVLDWLFGGRTRSVAGSHQDERAAKDTYVVTNNHYIGKGIVRSRFWRY